MILVFAPVIVSLHPVGWIAAAASAWFGHSRRPALLSVLAGALAYGALVAFDLGHGREIGPGYGFREYGLPWPATIAAALAGMAALSLMLHGLGRVAGRLRRR